MENLKKKLILLLLLTSLMAVIMINTHQGTARFRGMTVNVYGYVKDARDSAPIAGASVRLWFPDDGFHKTVTTSSSGYYSVSGMAFESDFYKLTITKTGYKAQTHTYFDNGGRKDFSLHSNRKIGVFFWSSELIMQGKINEYKAILESEGYTKFFFFQNYGNIGSAMTQIDNYEQSDDTLFVYIMGHGQYGLWEATDEYDSRVDLGGGSYLYSSQFRGYMDNFEAQKKGFLVESCHSGGFPKDFMTAPYFSMSSASQSRLAWSWKGLPWPNEGAFSHVFWVAVGNGKTATSAFNEAQLYVNDDNNSEIEMPQAPVKKDYSSYEFFG